MPKLISIFVLLSLFAFTGCDPSVPLDVPAIVEGDSMAPTICGDHLRVSCLDCQYEFKAEASVAAGATLTCPNCGYRKIKAADAVVVAAKQVQLQSFARFPRRWEVVGFELPSDSKNKTGVKRIVGLPGETIEIRNGDLYSNDKILRKSWALQKEIRIPVFDSKFNAIAPFDNSNRLRPANPDSGWRIGKESRMVSPVGDVDWLDYVHWRNCKRRGERDEAFPVEDSYGFNQGLARTLNAIDDVMVQLDAEFEVDSTMCLAFRRGKAEFVFEIAKSETEFLVSWQGATKRKPLVFKSRLPEELPGGVIEFSSFDKAIILRINGTSVFEIRENETATQESTESNFAADSFCVFRVGGKRGSFRINRTRVWRDIYYLKAPVGYEAPTTVKLNAGASEYILLGDNSPKSLDSRIWKNAGIDRSRLIGRLLRDSRDP